MNEESLKKFIGKRINLFLKSGIHYEGILENIDGQSIQILDKFDEVVFISIPEITHLMVKEKKGADTFKRGGG